MKAFFFLSPLLVATCGGGGGGGGPGGDDSEAVAMPKGVADGTPVSTETLGPNGGSLVSSDGRMTLTIPVGALATPMEISIQPITNTSPNSLGGAYRLAPEGVTFAQPVQISFHYSDADLTDTTPDGLGIAFQDSLGFWQSVNATTVDIAATTVTVSTTHFSDWSFFTAFRITPGSGTVKVRNSIGLTLLRCVAGASNCSDDGELCYLRTCRPMTASAWTVNGLTNGNANVGTVTSNGTSATYTAPASTLSIGANPVAVSAEITSGKKKGLLISSIKVVDDSIGYRVVMIYSDQDVPLCGFASSDLYDRIEFSLRPGADFHSFTVENIVNTTTVLGSPTCIVCSNIVSATLIVESPPEVITLKRGSAWRNSPTFYDDATVELTLETDMFPGLCTLHYSDGADLHTAGATYSWSGQFYGFSTLPDGTPSRLGTFGHGWSLTVTEE